MEFLAAVNWEDIVLVGSAMGIFTGGKVLHSKLSRSNSNGSFNQGLCNERHRVLERQHEENQNNFKTVFTKLDNIMEHLLKR